MIKPKSGICIDCGENSKPQPLTAGRCHNHYWNYRRKLSVAKKVKKSIPVTEIIIPGPGINSTYKNTPKKASKIISVTENIIPVTEIPIPVAGMEYTQFNEKHPSFLGQISPEMAIPVTGMNFHYFSNLSEWYKFHIENCKWVCENCGKIINNYSEKSRFSAQAHILPKSIFKSVKTLSINHITLGHIDCGCHARFDHSWERASEMNIFNKVKPIIIQMIALLNKDEVRRLKEILKYL